MKKNIFLLLPALVWLCLILFFSCGKESPTVVNGTVVDKYTGEPLEGVSIDIEKWQEKERGYFYFTTISTDVQGKFSFGDEETPDFIIQRMKKAGYLFKQNTIYDYFDNFKIGKTNEGVIPMIPLDGVLNLKVENLLGVHDTIFLAIFSPLLKSEIGISGGKVSLPNSISVLATGQSFSQNIPLASNEDVTIYWDYKPVIYSTAFQASANILRNDTVFYTISY